MSLASGTRLGPYEIQSALGAGGMGEVYRAKDTKLGRDVALKILPNSFTHDPERVARFRREAHVLASLNHPHIAQIHGLDEASGTPFLVLELVDGENLATRIARGPLPVDETLQIARQITEALEAAHEKGIVHRDLKPANIVLTKDGHVKVLDFGLAKTVEPSVSGDPANSPTLTSPAMMTGVGVILGTAAYMAPEQAKGRAADKRSDLWAFGCVLYEMLTAKRAFGGEDVTDTIAAVMRAEPDWNAVPVQTPAPIRKLLRRCMEKDRQRRLDSAAAARLEIDDALTSPATEMPAVATAPARRVATVVIAALAGGALIAALVTWTTMRSLPTPRTQPMRFAIVPPAAQPLAPPVNDRKIAISPDGTYVVYIAGASTVVGGQLMVRAIDRLEAEPVRGITAARAPFISPDSKWVGFFQTGELKKVAITGGSPVTLCRLNGGPRGASWGPDDTIVFATSDTSTGLLSVTAGGGEPKVLTKPDVAHGELAHLFPSVLPNGRAVLFTVTKPGPIEDAQVAALDLKTGQRKTLVRGGSDAEYVETGYLVYAAAGTLRAVRFDPGRLDVLSDPVPMVEQVAMANTGEAEFRVSRTGALVYVPGGVNGMTVARSLVWVTRQGREESIPAPARAYVALRLSPDGTRMALDSRDQENDIWIWDFARQTLTRFTFYSGNDTIPIWTPDGRRIVWSSTRGGVQNLFWQPADGTGTAERLTTASNLQVADSFSPDGLRLVLREVGPKTGNDIAVLAMDGKGQTAPLVQTMFDELNAEISPDGRWLAYQSNESGRDEIYVRPFPNVNGGRWQISTAGGTKPLWAHSGRELFDLDGNNVLTTVSIQTTPSFNAGNPTKLLEARYFLGQISGRPYDVSRDGQRFVIIKDAPPADQTSTSTPTSIIVVENWFEELKARMPTK